MATTQEFILVSLIHALENPAMRAAFLPHPTRRCVTVLHEILRLEPVIAKIKRKTALNLSH
ncbi:MAG: hypothetical protein M0C28_36275 [Candidatus Moduliflexus flocculans]|nr:hypothetical protein [Candidatus Moduliflexus flocculans]